MLDTSYTRGRGSRLFFYNVCPRNTIKGGSTSFALFATMVLHCRRRLFRKSQSHGS